MKVNRSKIEYLCINEGNDNKTVKREDKKVPRIKEFKYLGSTMQESGSCEREVKKRVQKGWNGWRKVSGVICNRRLVARVKRKVYSLVVRQAMVYGLKTVAVTKKQLEEMEVAEMKVLRIAMGETKKDKIRNEYIRSTVGRTVRNEEEGEQAEVVWTCHEERPRLCRKKDDGNGSTGKEEKRETKEKIFRCSEKIWRKLVRRRRSLKTERCGE